MPYIQFISVAVSPVGACWLLETFTDADGTLLEDHTPDICPTGFSWHPPGASAIEHSTIYSNSMRGGDRFFASDDYSELTFPPIPGISCPYKITTVFYPTSEFTTQWTMLSTNGDHSWVLNVMPDGYLFVGVNDNVNEDYAEFTSASPIAYNEEHTVVIHCDSDRFHVTIDGVAAEFSIAIGVMPTDVGYIAPTAVDGGAPSTAYISALSICPTPDSVDVPIQPPAGPTTALLLHFEDGDLSTSIADSSPYARTLTGNANCKVSTTRAKFGSSSLHITQNDSGGIAIPASADFAGTVTQWCLEFWFYRVVTTNTTQSPSIFILTAGSTVVSVQNLGSSARIATNQGNGQVYVPNPATSNAWHHAAIMFDSSQPSGSDGCICIDGVRELVLDGTGWNSVTASIRLFGSASGSVGAADSTDYWIDELAFWVNHLPFPFAGGFTPPTAPY